MTRAPSVKKRGSQGYYRGKNRGDLGVVVTRATSVKEIKGLDNYKGENGKITEGRVASFKDYKRGDGDWRDLEFRDRFC